MDRRWIICLAFILILIAAVSFHFNPDNFIADDAYFYLQIANNISQGNGSTFHQITPTNGYHPLWMLCCTLGAYIADGNRIALLHIMAVVQVIFYCVSLYLLWRISKKLNLHFLLAGVFVLTFVMINSGGMRLFEGHLAIMLQLATLSLFIDLLDGNRSKKLLVGIGTLLGLVFLARLDTLFFIVPIAVIGVWVILKDTRSILQKMIAIHLAALPAAFFAGMYLIYNMLEFGHLVPISGLIKSTYPQANFSLDALGPHGKNAVAASVFLLSILISIKRQNPKNLIIYVVLWLSIVLHAVYIATYSWGSQWYYTTAYLSLAIASMALLTEIGYLADNYKIYFSKLFSNTVTICLLVLMLLTTAMTVSKTFYNFSLFMVGTGKQKINPEFSSNPGKKVAEILNQHLAPGTKIYVFDAPGVLAFYTNFKILPADGLMNDLAYDQEVLNKGIDFYLKEKQVNYYLGPMPKNNMALESSTLKTLPQGTSFIVQMTTPISRKSGGSFHVENEDALILPIPLRPYGNEQPPYALWKIN